MNDKRGGYDRKCSQLDCIGNHCLVTISDIDGVITCGIINCNEIHCCKNVNYGYGKVLCGLVNCSGIHCSEFVDVDYNSSYKGGYRKQSIQPFYSNHLKCYYDDNPSDIRQCSQLNCPGNHCVFVINDNYGKTLCSQINCAYHPFHSGFLQNYVKSLEEKQINIRNIYLVKTILLDKLPEPIVDKIIFLFF